MAPVATAVPAFRTRRARPPLVLHVVFLRASPNAEMQSYHDGMTTSTGELEVTLRKSGHRLTGPRRAIWTVLANAGSHLTADEIADRVRTEDPSVNLSSIYRSPSLFSDPGIVRESNLGSGAASHWEVAHPDDQFNLRCESCGTVSHHAGELVDQIRTHLRDGHGLDRMGLDRPPGHEAFDGTCRTARRMHSHRSGDYVRGPICSI